MSLYITNLIYYIYIYFQLLVNIIVITFLCLSPPILSEGRLSSQLWPAEGGSGDFGGKRTLPEGPRAQGCRTHHRRGFQEQREGLCGLPGDRL